MCTTENLLNGSRPSWDQTWMSVAETISRRSHDPRHKVGAIVVTADNTQVLAVGYNGNWSGGPNEPESDEPGFSGYIHAELNCLLKTNYNDPKRKVMYVTMLPCRSCAKACIQAGIKEVVYRDEYRDLSGLSVLVQGDVLVRQFTG